MNDMKIFQPPAPGRRFDLVGNREMTKRDVGASLMWSFLNQINAAIERIDQQYLEMTRILLEQKRRLSTLEITVDHYRKILGQDDTKVTMFCIACVHEFQLPRAEAGAQDYTVTCPKCGNWALMKDNIPQEFSIWDLARISGFDESTVAKTLRENGFKKKGEHRLYSEETAEKVFAILKKKPRGGKKRTGGNGNGSQVDRG